MMSSLTKTALLTLALTVALTGAAFAQEILWDQTDGYESWQMGFFNNAAGGPPFGSTNYTVNDIVVPAGGWTIDVVRVYYDGFDPSWAGAVVSANLYLEPKTGSVPTGDPTTGTAVAVTCVVLSSGFLEVSATTLGLAVAEGEYWIGLTPTTPNSDTFSRSGCTTSSSIKN